MSRTANRLNQSQPAISAAPFDFPRMRFYQLWHERSQQSLPHRWFRGLLSDAARRMTRAEPA